MYFKSDIAFDESKDYEQIKLNNYNTLFKKIDNFDFYLINYFKGCNELISIIILRILKKYDLIKKNPLIIGLGNDEIVTDSLGKRCIDNIFVTSHLDLNTPKSSKIVPNVMGNTGIETARFIKGIVDEIKPDYLIVIDSLKTNSFKRLNKSIQITDSGIKPGSGIKGNSIEISRKMLNIPVIAIGVPFVLEASVIINDMMILLMKYLEVQRVNKKPLSIDDLDVFVSNEIKKEYLGSIGELNDLERYNLIKSFLEHTNNNLIVSSINVEDMINDIAQEISNGINLAIFDTTDFSKLYT